MDPSRRQTSVLRSRAWPQNAGLPGLFGEPPSQRSHGCFACAMPLGICPIKDSCDPLPHRLAVSGFDSQIIAKTFRIIGPSMSDTTSLPRVGKAYCSSVRPPLGLMLSFFPGGFVFVEHAFCCLLESRDLLLRLLPLKQGGQPGASLLPHLSCRLPCLCKRDMLNGAKAYVAPFACDLDRSSQLPLPGPVRSSISPSPSRYRPGSFRLRTLIAVRFPIDPPQFFPHTFPRTLLWLIQNKQRT